MTLDDLENAIELVESSELPYSVKRDIVDCLDFVISIKNSHKRVTNSNSSLSTIFDYYVGMHYEIVCSVFLFAQLGSLFEYDKMFRSIATKLSELDAYGQDELSVAMKKAFDRLADRVVSLTNNNIKEEL